MTIVFSSAGWDSIFAQSTAQGRAQAIAGMFSSGGAIEFRDAADALIREVSFAVPTVVADAGDYIVRLGNYTDAATGAGTPAAAIFKASGVEQFRCSCGVGGGFYSMLAAIVAGVPIDEGDFGIRVRAIGAEPPPDPGSPLAVVQSILTPIRVAQGGTFSLAPYVSGGTPPYTYDVDSGALPANTTLDTNTGIVSFGAAAALGTTGSIVFGVDDSASVPVVVAPVNTSAPTITGVPTEGQAIFVNPGVWSNSPTSYTYAIKRGATTVATTQSYTLAAADVGQTLTAEVTATNSAGSAMATSAAFGPIAAAPVTGDLAVALDMLSDADSGTYAMSFAQGFAAGDVPAGTYLTSDAAAGQVDVLSRWPDGSVSLALLSVRDAFTTGVKQRFTLTTTASAPGGSPLTLAALVALAPDISVSLSGIGSVTLASLLGLTSTGQKNSAGLVRQRIAGPVMSEWHFYSPVGVEGYLAVWFYVRLYAGNEIEVEVVVENGWLLATGPTEWIYDLTVSVNGAPAWVLTAVDHRHHTRYGKVFWLTADPEASPSHDVAYLMSTRLTPNYFGAPSSTALDALPTDETPFARLLYPSSMGEPGSTESIGLLPKWDANYCQSGDARAYRSVIVHAYAAGRYAHIYRDETTLAVPIPTDYPQIGGLTNNPPLPAVSGTAPPGWKMTHHPSVGYCAHLITGRFSHLEMLQFSMFRNYKDMDYRQDAKGIYDAHHSIPTSRGTAWGWRTLVQAIAVTPDGSMKTSMRSMWRENMLFYKAYYLDGVPTGYANELGFIRASGDYNFAEDPVWRWKSGFMQDFLVQSLGYCWDLQPGIASAEHQAVRDWLYRYPVGMLGDGVDTCCFRRGEQYTIPVALKPDFTWATSYRDIMDRVESFYALTPITCSPGASLKKWGSDTDLAANYTDSDNFASGFWGNLTPAIAYAVDHNAPGALESWGRIAGNPLMTGQIVANFGCWAIRPR